MRLLLTALIAPLLAGAAILPDTIGAHEKKSSASAAISDRPVWNEYGLKESETVSYGTGAARFTATAYRLGDSTAALAVFDWQRPSGATPSTAAAMAAQTADTLLVAHGNYVVSFNGYKPSDGELKAVLGSLRNVDTTSHPTLPGYLPSDNLIPNSERYVTGPVALQRFYPGIPPSVAGFNSGAEAQLGSFRSAKGDLKLAIFEYPTHQIAMQKVTEFEKLPGAVVKRSGPLVAVTLTPADPDFAQLVLAQVRYEASITLDEYVPSRRDNIGELILTAFVLIGVLFALSLVAGLFMGGFRRAWARFRGDTEPDPLIMLHLNRDEPKA